MRVAPVAAPLATAIAVVVSACATTTLPSDPPTPPKAVAGAGTPEPPPFRCGPRDREWELWFKDTFGTGLEVINDGPDGRRLVNLTGEKKAEAEVMLRRGIAACDFFAVQAIERAGWRALIPDLTRAVGADNLDFRAQTILALNTLGSGGDFTAGLIEALRNGTEQARITAAIGAGRFSLARMRQPLLERVRLDRSWIVRNHAAESLLELADIYPRDLHDHPSIAAALIGPDTKQPPVMELFGWQPALGSDELARLADAAAKLDAAITERLAAGPCSKVVTPPSISLHILRLPENENVVALTAEDRIGSCERTLGFVAFLRVQAGFGKWLMGGAFAKQDPVSTSIDARSAPITVEYRRAAKTLMVGSLAVDLTKGNVMVLAADGRVVVSRYQITRSLSFERHGRTPPEARDALPFRQEIEAEVRAVLNGSTELREFIDPQP